MPDSKPISELLTAEQTTANDLFETAIPNVMTETGYVSRKNSFSAFGIWLCNTFQFTSQLHTTAKTIIGAINEVYQASGAYVEKTGSLTAGNTTVIFTDASIIDGCTIDVYVDEAFLGVVPTAQVTDGTNHTVTLTFPAQSSNMPVKVRIS